MDLKKQAVQYYNENKVPKQLENLLNTMYLDQPADLYGYMSKFFANLSKPICVSKVIFLSGISSLGYENLKAYVYCKINGEIKLTNDLSFFHDDRPYKEPVTLKSSSNKPPSSKKDKKSQNKKDAPPAVLDVAPSKVLNINCSFKSMSALVKKEFIPLLNNQLIDDQVISDSKLKEHMNNLIEESESKLQEKLYSTKPSEVLQIEILKANSNASDSIDINYQDSPENLQEVYKAELIRSSLFTSQLLIETSASVKGISLYERLLQVFSIDTSNLKMAIPAMSMFSIDISSPGKLNLFRNVMIVPKLNEDFLKSLDLLVSLYHHLDQAVQQKTGPSTSKNINGALKPSLDKPEQLFDLLNTTAKTSMDIEFHQVFDLILDIGAQDIFDEDKKKYEVSFGVQKTGSELIALYKEWVENYSVIGIIDGVVNTDNEVMNLLCTELSPFCFIMMSDKAENEDSIMQSLNENLCNSIVLEQEKYCATVSNINEIIGKIKENKGTIMMTDDWCSAQPNASSVDMAVAFGCSFIRMASPTSWGNLSFNRWVEIYNELKNEEKLVITSTYGFEDIKKENVENGNAEGTGEQQA